MKTITELSGTVIRMAAAALAEARRSLPGDEAPPASPPAEAAPPASSPPEAAPPGGEGASADAPGSGGTEVAPPIAAAAPSPKPEPPPESEAVKAALDEAVAKATGFSGDRLAMLRAAVQVAGPRTDDVRLVRVFGVDEKLSGARVVGEYQYVVDHFPAAMKQVTGAQKEERGGGHRGGGGGGRGGRGAKGSATGGFSMDSLRDDRKKEGGGRGRPGGPRRPGGGPARPPGGAPKK